MRSRCCGGREWIATLLPAVVDASPAKQGLRMPGTDIPIVSPAELAADQPDAVVLFLADLLPEVRAAYPEVEAGGRPLGERRDTAHHEAWSSTRSRARHRPRVGPMLPTGSPSWSEISA